MFIRLIFRLAQIFFLYQLSLRLVIACDDECIISISKAFTGNYSQQIDGIFSRISKTFRTDLPQDKTVIHEVDSLIELGRQTFYDQVFTQTAFELNSASSGKTKLDSVMQSSEKLFSVVIDVLNPKLRDLLAVVRGNFAALGDWERPASLRISDADQTFSPSNRRRSRRSMSFNSRGSLPRLTRRKEPRYHAYSGYPRMVSTIPLRKDSNGTADIAYSWRKRSFIEAVASFSQARSRILKRTLNSVFQGPLQQIVARSEPSSSGAPRTVSTIPVAATFDPIKTDPPTSPPPSKVTRKECLIKALPVCVPNLVRSLKKRSIAIVSPASALIPHVISRLFATTSNPVLQGSLQHFTARSEQPSSGAPRTVSTIPVSATFDPIPADNRTSHSSRKTINNECLFNFLPICVPNVLDGLRRRSIAILSSATVPRYILEFTLQPSDERTVSRSSNRKVIMFEGNHDRLIRPMPVSRITSKKYSDDRDQSALDALQDHERNKTGRLTVSHKDLQELIGDIEIRLMDYHQGLWNGPMKEYILSFE